MTDVDVRLATPADAAVLAGLMIEWEHERSGAELMMWADLSSTSREQAWKEPCVLEPC